MTGCVQGSVIPAIHIPAWIDMYMNGALPLNKLLSKTYPLERVNQAVDDLLSGEVVKPVLLFS